MNTSVKKAFKNNEKVYRKVEIGNSNLSHEPKFTKNEICLLAPTLRLWRHLWSQIVKLFKNLLSTSQANISLVSVC